ncbi:hypothetical protein YDYSG_29160 [Paenibacillus tyrfis]|nr:hypothetical protein YDYSG_29160 [Paenibacillus tyrfis]
MVAGSEHLCKIFRMGVTEKPQCVGKFNEDSGKVSINGYESEKQLFRKPAHNRDYAAGIGK